MSEEWRRIAWFDGYEVSDLGRVRSWRPDRNSKVYPTEPRIVQPVQQKNGYLTVTMRRQTRRVHRLVAEAFLPGGWPGLQVAHNNGIRSDNRASNLRWATPKENSADKEAHGTRGFKLTMDLARQIRERYNQCDITQRELAALFGVGKTTVGRILLNQIWKEPA